MPGLSIDLMELRRLDFVAVGSEIRGGVSISAAEKERLRDGDRKELGESEVRRFASEG
jgi:hypothetical protein